MRTLLLASFALALSISASAQTAAEIDRVTIAIDCDDIATLEVGAATSGTLVEASDCMYQDGSTADYYVFKLDQDASVTITHRSNDFDAYLVLYEGNGLIMEIDDDSGAGPTGFDSMIAADLDAGVYMIAANHISGEGTYTVEVSTN
ncbi:hypothetical protein [Rubrivirga sp.]|uniref:hypothetical protein n=1 Tax=Rubrivirga sp. TaxID=1885344 RepID=UPI003C731784